MPAVWGPEPRSSLWGVASWHRSHLQRQLSWGHPHCAQLCAEQSAHSSQGPRQVWSRPHAEMGSVARPHPSLLAQADLQSCRFPCDPHSKDGEGNDCWASGLGVTGSQRPCMHVLALRTVTSSQGLLTLPACLCLGLLLTCQQGVSMPQRLQQKLLLYDLLSNRHLWVINFACWIQDQRMFCRPQVREGPLAQMEASSECVGNGCAQKVGTGDRGRVPRGHRARATGTHTPKASSQPIFSQKLVPLRPHLPSSPGGPHLL